MTALQSLILFLLFLPGVAGSFSQPAVRVRGGGQLSNPVDFFVQVPTKVTQESMSGVTQCDPTPCTIDEKPNRCGAFRTIIYPVADQEGQPIREIGTVTELISRWSDPSEALIDTQTRSTNEIGRFTDVVGMARTAPNCPLDGEGADLRQKFLVVINGKQYSLSTINRLQLAKSSGQYAITVTM